MTVTAAPWTSTQPQPQTVPQTEPQTARTTTTPPDVTLVLVPADVLAALADGDLVAARALSTLPLTEYLVDDDECRGVWLRRRDQIAGDPEDAIWVTRLVRGGDGAVVGRAGFHGAPDDRGMVEVGYAIDPALRRLGYARAALAVLLEMAAADPRVAVVRATVSPDNHPSRSLIDAAGFLPVGEQWDDVDGLEIILERTS